MPPFHSNVTPGHFVTIVCVDLLGCVCAPVDMPVLRARLISRAVHVCGWFRR